MKRKELATKTAITVYTIHMYMINKTIKIPKHLNKEEKQLIK